MTTKLEQYRRARESAGLSLSQAAKLLGLTRGGLYSIERGTALPTDEQIADMVRTYDVTDSYLRTGQPTDDLADQLAHWNDAPDWMQTNILHEWSKRPKIAGEQS